MDGRPENVSKNERPRMRFRRNNDESPSRTIQLVVKTHEQSSDAILLRRPNLNLSTSVVDGFANYCGS